MENLTKYKKYNNVYTVVRDEIKELDKKLSNIIA